MNKQKQKSSAKPKQRIQVKNITQMNMPKLNINLPKINTKVAVGAKGMGTKGLGSGMGGGGGLGFGAKAVSLFKVKSSGERFLFLVDASSRTMLYERGGLKAYTTIKNEVSKLIGGLPSSIVFNVGFFESNRVALFKPNLVAATDDSKGALKSWITQFNKSAKEVGVRNSKVYRIQNKPLGVRRPNELTLTQTMIEQAPDAVFVISAGWNDPYGNVHRRPTQKELQELKDRREKAKKALERKGWDSKKLRTYQREKYKLDRAAQAAYEAYQKGREKTVGRQIGSSWQAWAKGKKEYEYKGDEPPPELLEDLNASPTALKLTVAERDVKNWLKGLVSKHYADRSLAQKKSGPIVNVILFAGKEEAEKLKANKDKVSAIKNFTKDYRGKFKMLVSSADKINY